MSDKRYDDHIWLTVRGKAWAIFRIDWPLMLLWRGYEPRLEWCVLDCSTTDFDAYCRAAVELLEELN